MIHNISRHSPARGIIKGHRAPVSTQENCEAGSSKNWIPPHYRKGQSVGTKRKQLGYGQKFGYFLTVGRALTRSQIDPTGGDRFND